MPASVARISLVGLMALVFPLSSAATAQIEIPELDEPVSKVKEAVDSVSVAVAGAGSEGVGLPGSGDSSASIEAPSVGGMVDAASDLMATSSSETSSVATGSSGDEAEGGSKQGGAVASRMESDVRFAAGAREVRDPKPVAVDHDVDAVASGGHTVAGVSGAKSSFSCPQGLGALCLLFGPAGEGGVEVLPVRILALTGIGLLFLALLAAGMLGLGAGAVRVGRGSSPP